MNAAMDFGRGHHKTTIPVPVRVERHEFDESHDDAALAGEAGKGLHLIIINAPDEHRIDLCRREPRVLRGIDAVHYCREGFGARDFLEFRTIQRIEADIDTSQPGLDESLAAFRQQVPIRGHRQIFDAQRMQPRDVILHAFADQRLAARDANFADAQSQENSRQAVEFRPGENFVVVAIIFRISRAAVHAAEVAAVGNRDA